jgi:hypothetical protein
VRNDWCHKRAFVLQFGPDADVARGRLEGRIEHVASTRSARFGSLQEFLQALQTLLDEADPLAASRKRGT